jgi:hypothetical protein
MPVELDVHPIARLMGADRRLPILLIANRPSISGGDHVSFFQAGVEGWRSPIDEARNPHTSRRQLRGRATAAASSPSAAEILIEHAGPGTIGVALAKHETNPGEKRPVVRYVASLDVSVEKVVREFTIA